MPSRIRSFQSGLDAIGAQHARLQQTDAAAEFLVVLGLAEAAVCFMGDGVRVPTLPCFERFDRQSAEYRESVLPKSVTKRVAIEAGVTGLWWKYVGTEGKVLGIDRFGLSAPGDTVFKKLGITKEAVIEAAK